MPNSLFSLYLCMHMHVHVFLLSENIAALLNYIPLFHSKGGLNSCGLHNGCHDILIIALFFISYSKRGKQWSINTFWNFPFHVIFRLFVFQVYFILSKTYFPLTCNHIMIQTKMTAVSKVLCSSLHKSTILSF